VSGKLKKFFAFAIVFTAFQFAYSQTGDDVFAVRNPAILELRMTVKRISHLQPWKIDRIETQKIPAVFLGQDLALAGNIDPAAVSFMIRNEKDQELAADMIAYDTELKAGLFRIRPDARVSNDPRNPLLPMAGNASMRLSITPDYSERHTSLKALGSADLRHNSIREYTVFYENTGSSLSPAGNTMIPVIFFSAINPAIKPGDILVRNDSLFGIVNQFDAEKKIGTAVSSIFISRFLTDSIGAQPRPEGPLNIQDLHPVLPEYPGTVIMDPGFRTALVEMPLQKNYFGLRPDTSALMITHVMPNGGGSDALIPGDIILALDEQAPGPGGTLNDPVFGRIPVECAVILSGGRLRKKGEELHVRIVRDSEIRTVSVSLTPFLDGNYRVPDQFARPSYLISGGLVFVELSEKYIQESFHPSIRLQYLNLVSNFRENLPERYVILDSILPTSFNRGYRVEKQLVLSVNGSAVRSLAHLNSLIEEAKKRSQTIVIALEGNRTIIMNSADLDAGDQEVRKTQAIPYLSNLQ